MSTIADKPLPMLRRKPTDSLGFTDFKLDPLQLNGTSHLLVPHQHREATRVFCLRLQPRSQTQLATTLKQFQDQSYLQCGPNQAHQSPPHLSLLGNIAIDCDTHSSTARWHAVDMLVKLVDDEIQKALLTAAPTPVPQPTFGGYTVKDKPTRSVNMRITLPRLYSRLSQDLQNLIAKEYLSSHIRLEHPPSFLATRKSATSISSSVSKATTAPSTIVQWIPLAYNVLKSISRDDAVTIKAMANDLINVNKWVNGKETSWELALHEIMLESQAVGKTQQVTTIKTWPLYNDDDDEAIKTLVHSVPLLRPAPHRPFTWTSFIPTSIRVKFSVLSSRFR